MSAASTSKANGGGSSSSTAAPSPTLYVKNIEGKIKKPELRRQLYTLFSAYGRVLDVVATRAPGMRGQAFVVFESPTTSTAAKRALHSFVFYGKELHVDYATGAKSKAILRREIGHDAVQEMDLERSRTTVSRRGEKRQVDNPADEEEEDPGRKRVKLDENEEGGVLNAVDVPEGIEVGVLDALFARQDGFVEVKVLEEKAESWTAQIRFQDTDKAKAAKHALDGIQLDPTYTLSLVTP